METHDDRCTRWYGRSWLRGLRGGDSVAVHTKIQAQIGGRHHDAAHWLTDESGHFDCRAGAGARWEIPSVIRNDGLRWRGSLR